MFIKDMESCSILYMYVYRASVIYVCIYAFKYKLQYCVYNPLLVHVLLLTIPSIAILPCTLIDLELSFILKLKYYCQ